MILTTPLICLIFFRFQTRSVCNFLPLHRNLCEVETKDHLNAADLKKNKQKRGSDGYIENRRRTSFYMSSFGAISGHPLLWRTRIKRTRETLGASRSRWPKAIGHLDWGMGPWIDRLHDSPTATDDRCSLYLYTTRSRPLTRDRKTIIYRGSANCRGKSATLLSPDSFCRHRARNKTFRRRNDTTKILVRSERNSERHTGFLRARRKKHDNRPEKWFIRSSATANKYLSVSHWHLFRSITYLFISNKYLLAGRPWDEQKILGRAFVRKPPVES